MEKYESIPLELSNVYIEASAGFSLDIGCSTAKLLYRSKDDYKNGKPIKDELKDNMGRIFLTPSIPRTEVDDVIEIIRTKCDLRPAEGDIKPEVYTTGAGCNFFRERLETELNVRLANVKEMGCFVEAFTEIAKHAKYEDIFEPTDEKTLKDIQAEERLMEKLSTLYREFGKDLSQRATEEEVAAEKNAEKSVLPCLIAVFGSGAGYVRINEDGTFELCGGNVFSGRAFLGLAALTTGEKDFSRILQAVERGSCRSVDEYAEDLVAQNKTEETKGGDKSSEDFYDGVNEFTKPAFPFGKAVTRSRDEISDDDVLHSLYRTFMRNMVNVGRLYCALQGLNNFYFSGNFTQNSNARNMIEVHNAGENVLAPKNHRVQVKFIKNGGHLGALGAFLQNKDGKTK